MKVITWQDTRGGYLNITPDQEERFTKAGRWPKNASGEEYCQVSHGLHEGVPTWTDAQVSAMIVDIPCQCGDDQPHFIRGCPVVVCRVPEPRRGTALAAGTWHGSDEDLVVDSACADHLCCMYDDEGDMLEGADEWAYELADDDPSAIKAIAQAVDEVVNPDDY
jgi:hypothetical protein